MPSSGSREDSSVVDELLEQGLTFFAANRVEQAVARWRQVLELAPGESRALDYLASAGHPFAEGTGQSGTPVGPNTTAPDTGEIEVFEVAPISHQTDWPRAPTMAPVRAAPSRVSLLAPWVIIAVLVPVVGYLVWAQIGGRSEPAAREAARSVARPALSVPPASQPAPAVVPMAPEAAAAALSAPAASPVEDTYVVTLSVSPANAIIKVDGQQVARGEYIARLRRDGVAHTVEISAPRHETRELTFVDEPPPERIRLSLDRAARKARRARREAARAREKGDDKGGPKEAEKQAEQAQPEPPKTAPAKAEPAKAEPAKTESAKAALPKTESPKTETAKTAPPKTAPPPPARKSDNINPWATSK